MGRWLLVWRMRMRSLLRGGDVERDLARELGGHLDALIDEKRAAGLSPREARREAMREFGAVGGVSEACRDTRRVAVIQNLLRDLRFAIRGLLRAPVLLVAATASIGLGVGANLTLFALGSQLLLSVPTAASPGDLVFIRTGNGSHVSFAAWRGLDDSRALGGVAGYQLEAGVNWRGPSETITVSPLIVTANFFDVLGVPLARGRGFSAREAALERHPRLVVLSHGFWERRLGADPDVLGTTLVLNGEPYSVTGVLPADLVSLPGYGLTPDLYLPANRALMPQVDANRPAVMLVGRRHAGQSVEAARTAVATVLSTLSDQLDDRELGTLTALAPFGSVGQMEDADVLAAFMVMLMLVAGLVLVIACANVAGLLLARATTRGREVALRVALGAGRWRLRQQFLAEGFVLAVAGVLAGALMTLAIGRILPALALPIPIPISLGLALDVRLVLLALALVVLTTISTALVPALRTSRASAAPSLRVTGVTTGRRQRTRRVLVTGQVAVAVILLFTALLFLRNLSRASSIETGFDVAHLTVGEVSFVEGRQGHPAEPALDVLASELRRVPGVREVAFTEGVPLTLFFGATVGTSATFGDDPEPRRIDYVGNIVGPDYFDALGIDVLAGRAISAGDGPGAPRVAVVNQEFVRRYFDGESPIGQRLVEQGSRERETLTIVGVVADSRYRTIGEGPTPAIYRAYAQQAELPRMARLLIRAVAPGAVRPDDVRAAVRRVDASAALELEPLEAMLAFAFMPSRVGAVLVGTLGAIGTLLAMVGLYGVIAFTVQRRTAEIGVRVALGASRRQVVALVLREGAWLVGGGAVAGSLIALLLAQPLAAFLVAGLSPADPVSLAGTVALLVLVSLAALLGPMRRALGVAPLAALRTD